MTKGRRIHCGWQLRLYVDSGSPDSDSMSPKAVRGEVSHPPAKVHS